MTDEPGPLIASGRAADVYDLGDGTVLRRYRTVHPDLELEARIMRYVAERGYPVPTVHSVDGSDLIMDRVDGDTMLERLSAAPWKVVWYARVLGPPATATGPDRSSDVDARRHGRRVASTERAPSRPAPDERDHVAGGPVVIDWTNAAGGPAGFDGAITYVEVATYAGETTVERIGQRVFARAFRRFRGRRRGRRVHRSRLRPSAGRCGHPAR